MIHLEQLRQEIKNRYKGWDFIIVNATTVRVEKGAESHTFDLHNQKIEVKK